MSISPPTCSACRRTFLSLGLLPSESITHQHAIYCSDICAESSHSPNVLKEMRFTTRQYRDFLLSRIFSEIHYPSNEALLLALKEAGDIERKGTWRDAKQAYNTIGNKVVFRSTDDVGFDVTLQHVTVFLMREVTSLYELNALK